MSMTAVATATGTTFVPSNLLRKRPAEARPEGVEAVQVAHPEMATRIQAQWADLGGSLGPVVRWGAGLDADGRKKYAYHRFDPGRGEVRESLGTAVGSPADEVAIFESLRTSFGCKFLSENLAPIDPMRNELQAFEDSFPLIASTLIDAGVIPDQLRKVPVPAGLEPGVWCVAPPFRCAGARVLEALGRFAAGDLGDYGAIPGDSLNELQRWSARVQPRHVRNRMAHESGFGLIIGRYPCPGHRKAGAGHAWIMKRLRGPEHRPVVLCGWWPSGSAIFPAIAGVTDPADMPAGAPTPADA